MSFREYVKEIVIDRIDDLEGDCEYTIVNGIVGEYVIVGSYRAKEIIGKYIHDYFKFLDKYNQELGCQYDLAHDPEVVLTDMVREIVEEILEGYEVGYSSHNELTLEKIEEIKDGLQINQQ